MATLSSFDFWIPLIVVLVALTVFFGGFKARAFVLVLGALVGFASGLPSNALKHLVNRPRPCQLQPVRFVDLKKAKPRFLALFSPPVVRASIPDAVPMPGHSFPSSHVVNNFVIAVVIIAFYGWRGALYVPFACAVAYSRIYTGSHWPSDVAVSVFIGCGIGLFGVAGAEAAWRRYGSMANAEWRRSHPSLISSETVKSKGSEQI